MDIEAQDNCLEYIQNSFENDIFGQYEASQQVDSSNNNSPSQQNQLQIQSCANSIQLENVAGKMLKYEHQSTPKGGVAQTMREFSNEVEKKKDDSNSDEYSKCSIHSSPFITVTQGGEHEDKAQSVHKNFFVYKFRSNNQRSQKQSAQAAGAGAGEQKDLEEGQLIQYSKQTQKSQQTDLTKIQKELDNLGIKKTAESEILDKYDNNNNHGQSNQTTISQVDHRVYYNQDQQTLIEVTTSKIQKSREFSCCKIYQLFIGVLDFAFKILFFLLAFNLVSQQEVEIIPNSGNFDLMLAGAIASALSTLVWIIFHFDIVSKMKRQSIFKSFNINGLQFSMLFQITSFSIIFYCLWGEFQMLQALAIFVCVQSVLIQYSYINFFQDLSLRISYCLTQLKFDPFLQKSLLTNTP